MNQFKGKRRVFWLGGLAALVLGILAGAVVLPTLTTNDGGGPSKAQVPNMQNVPPDEAPKMKVEVEKE
jgi:hypothetical protein